MTMVTCHWERHQSACWLQREAFALPAYQRCNNHDMVTALLHVPEVWLLLLSCTLTG